MSSYKKKYIVQINLSVERCIYLYFTKIGIKNKKRCGRLATSYKITRVRIITLNYTGIFIDLPI